MLDPIGDQSPLSVTLAEAIAMLQRLETGATAAEVVLLLVARKSPASAADTALGGEAGTEAPPPAPGLERLGKPVFTRLPMLVTFYLIGCAYRDGATSLRAVAKEFERRDLEGILPDGVPFALSTLSETLKQLSAEVFADYLKRPYLSLLSYPQGEGKPGVLGPDGWKAWAACRELLARCGLLPDW